MLCYNIVIQIHIEISQSLFRKMRSTLYKYCRRILNLKILLTVRDQCRAEIKFYNCYCSSKLQRFNKDCKRHFSKEPCIFVNKVKVPNKDIFCINFDDLRVRTGVMKLYTVKCSDLLAFCAIFLLYLLFYQLLKSENYKMNCMQRTEFDCSDFLAPIVSLLIRSILSCIPVFLLLV